MSRSVGESAKDRWVLFGAHVDVLEPDPDVVEESTHPAEDGVVEGEDADTGSGEMRSIESPVDVPGPFGDSETSMVAAMMRAAFAATSTAGVETT